MFCLQCAASIENIFAQHFMGGLLHGCQYQKWVGFTTCYSFFTGQKPRAFAHALYHV